MSAEAVEEVIRRAISNEPFRHKLFSSPGAALQDYDLTQHEVDMLSGLDEQRLSEFVDTLGGRTTK
jgi:hypothetical protein